jgi:hypothetical protein
MEPQIEQIYHEQVRTRVGDARYLRVLRSIIDVAKQHNAPLQQDALYFLANSITDMIVGPVRIAGERGLKLESGSVSEEELFSYIESDLPLIIKSALTTAQGRKRQQISATSVIIGLGMLLISC